MATASRPIDERPTLAELVENVDVGDCWRQLGISLKLELKELDKLDMQYNVVGDKLSHMFQLWLDQNPQASRRDIIAALHSIKKNTMAYNYAKKFSDDEQNDHEKDITTDFLRLMTSMLRDDPDLAIIAHELRDQYIPLVIRVKNSPNLKIDDCKVLVQAALQDTLSYCSHVVLKRHRLSLDEIKNAHELIYYLQSNNFITYLTYGLLKQISQQLKDAKIDQEFDSYEAKYTELLKCATFKKIITVFNQHPTLKPSAVIGFPLVKLKLERPDLFDCLHDLHDIFDVPMPFPLAANEQSVVLTYCIFPSDLKYVMDFFNDPKNKEKLRNNKISVFLELPKVGVIRDIEVSSVKFQIVAADDDEAKKSDLASQVSSLSQMVLPIELVSLLYTEGVISEQIFLDAQSLGGVLSKSSMEELCTTVSKDSAMLQVLGSVLLKSDVTVPLANDILIQCEKLFPSSANSHDQLLLVYSKSPPLAIKEGESNEGILREDPDDGDNLSPEDTSVHELYSSLINSVHSFIVASTGTEMVAQNLFHTFQEMRAQLTHAETANDVLMLVEQNCSIDNVHCLKTVIDHCDISIAKEFLKDYRAEIDRMFEQTNISDCLDVSFRLTSSPRFLLKCNTVEFHLSLEFLQRPLKDIKVLLTKLFNNFSNEILLESIHKQKEFIAVICFVSHHLINILQLKANECNLEELSQKGVISLTVGYCTLLDKNDYALKQSLESKAAENGYMMRESAHKKLLKDIETLKKTAKALKKKNSDLSAELSDITLTKVTLERQFAIEQQESTVKTKKIKQLQEKLKAISQDEDTMESISQVKLPKDFDELLQSIGAIRQSAVTYEIYKGEDFNFQSLKDMILNPEIQIKVKPVLISLSGLPKSGKTWAFNTFVEQHVLENPLMVSKRKSRHRLDEDISHYDLIAIESLQEELCVTEATKESACMLGILSAFKQHLATKGKVPILAETEMLQCFTNSVLDKHFQYMRQYLAKSLKNESTNYVNKLEQLNESSLFVNLWDIPTNKTVHYILSALQGHLTNNHMWLFLQLERDGESLFYPPHIEKGSRDGAVLMKCHLRLHYLLHSCRLSKSLETSRREVCTIFVNHNEKYDPTTLREDVNELKESIKSAAEHMCVNELLDERFETDLNQSFQTKFKEVVSTTESQDIPIAWVFLRSFLHRSEKVFVGKNEFKALAEECGMDEQSQKGFLKFYTSFGSIFDINMVNSQYQYVITKPIHFLRSLDNLLYPSRNVHKDHPTVTYGIFSTFACRQILKEDWHAFIDALVCLNLATKLSSDSIQMPIECPLDPGHGSTYYYIPSSRTGPLLQAVDPDSVHLITNIDTPDVFTQAMFTKHLLAILPRSKLVVCTNSNKTIIKDGASNTTVTLVSNGPATKLNLDEPNSVVCSAVVQAYEDMAKTSTVSIKYKFVTLCVKSFIPDVEFLPSALYHVLPDNDLCKDCQEDGIHDDEQLKVWNNALKYNQSKSKPTGKLEVKEIRGVADKILSYDMISDCHSDVITSTFELESSHFQSKKIRDLLENDITSAVNLWIDKYQKKRGSQEPRRAFARRLSVLGKSISEKFDEHVHQDAVRRYFEKLANKVDLYYIPRLN